MMLYLRLFHCCSTYAHGADQEPTSQAELSATLLSPPWGGREEGEDEGTLSDLDPEIEQYIASEKEVSRNRIIVFV